MKKLLLLLMVFILAVSAMFSCKGGNKDDNSGSGGGNSNVDTNPQKGLIYGNGENAHIICNYKGTVYQEETFDRLENLAAHIEDVAGYYPYIIEATGIADGHEIVIGDSTRDISVAAMAELNEKIRKKNNSLEYDLEGWDKIAGYAVYSDGNSVAIVWSDWQLEEAAIEYFARNFILSDKLELEPGYIKTELFNLEQFLKERGEQVKADQWEALRAQIPAQYADDIVSAFQSLYALYDIDMVRWLANLYDPQVVIVDSQGNPVPEYNQEGNVIYGGGWYHSNSGRDNEGFLPDIENTYVALSFVSSTGMAEMLNDDWVAAMPDWLKTQVGLWFQNLQDPDSFFYHPQWPKEFINSKGLQSRITRDRGSAKTVLRMLGYEQLYPETAATSNPGLPGKLNGSSSVIAASKVVATAGMLWQYQSNENFAEYLKGLDTELATYNDPSSKAVRFYVYGNNFQSTTNMMTPEMKKMTEEFFNKHQNPETGTWDVVPSYSATNGIHKIGSVYNAIGAKMNYIDQMVESCIEVVSWTVDEKPINSGVELYNAWSCFPYIYKNVRNHDPDGESKIQAIKDRVFASAADLIMIARNQIAGFRRPDGSYGYTRTGSCTTAQGAPVAIAGVNEGDVNGNAIASLNVIEYIMYALELGDYMPNMFNEYERMEFVHILNNLGPVIKYEEELGDDVIHTFEDIPDGELPQDYSTELDAGRNPIPGTFAEVTQLDGNRVLEVVAKHRGTDDNGRNLTLRAPIYRVRNNANMASLEFDICILSEGTKAGNSLIQFNITGAGSPVIYPYFGVDGSGNVFITTDKYVMIGNIGKVDEVISFKLEYFWDEGIYKVYSNGIYIGSNTATYNQRNHQEVQSFALGAPSTATIHYWLDNVRMVRTLKEYVDETLATSPNHSFSGNADGTPVQGFISNGTLVVPYGGSANYAGEGETLELHGANDGSAVTVTIPAFTSEGVLANTTKLDLDFKVTSLYGGSMKIAIIDKNGNVITGLGFAESADGTKLVGTHYSSDLITSFCNFYSAPNAEGQDNVTLNLSYCQTNGVMKVSVGEATYTVIAGVIDGISGIKIYLEGGESVVELDSAYLENLYEEVSDEEIRVDPNVEDFESDYISKVEEWNCTHTGHNGSPEQSVTNLYFPTGVSAVFQAESSYSNSHGAVARVLADATGNKYLNIVAPKRVSDRDRAHNYVINAQNCVLDANVYIVETDIKLDSVLPDGTATHRTYLQITLTNATDNKYVRFDLDNNAAKVVVAGVELADWDTWFKLKIEYYPAQGVIQLYADGAFRGELTKGDAASSSADTAFSTLGSQITKVNFSGANSSSGGFSISFDNSVLYSAKKDYVGGRAPEVIYPDGPVYETFDEKVVESETLSNNFTGKTGTTVSYTASVNDAGSRAFLRTDEAIGNNFITIYSPGRVNTKDRSHSVIPTIVTLSDNANMVALESKVFFDSRSTSKDYIQILFSHGKNNAEYGQLNMSIKNGAAYFGGVKVGYLDEWFTLKFEFYLDVGKLKVYNNDLFVGEITNFTQANAANADKLVSGLAQISYVAINSYNGNGSLLFSVDDVAAYTIAKEYVEEPANDLPEAHPAPDTFNPETGEEGGEEPETPPVDPDPEEPKPEEPKPEEPKPEEPKPEEPTPDTPDDEEEIETPEFDSDIPDVAIPGDEDLKEENADEWTN